MPAHATHDTLARMADDIRQLTQPMTVPVRTRARGGRTVWHVVDHDALLDQLRAATMPSTSTNHGPERRRPPGPRTPIHIEAHDRLAEIYVELAAWHVRLQLPSPPRDEDWQKAALRQLVGAAPTLAPSIADELADAVYKWWRLAARVSGWQLDELLNAR